MSAPLLDVRGLSISFGGLKAVQDFNLALPAHGLHGLIGPNGAGKTTVFNVLTGVCRQDAGTMALGGASLVGLRAAEHGADDAGSARAVASQHVLVRGQGGEQAHALEGAGDAVAVDARR